MKIFSIAMRWLLTRATVLPDDEEVDWTEDPLSHPALRNMSARDLADLPFNRGCRQADRGRPCWG